MKNISNILTSIFFNLFRKLWLDENLNNEILKNLKMFSLSRSDSSGL